MLKFPMLTLTKPIPTVKYTDRYSSYGIFKNKQGEIAIVEMLGWGYIFPGGGIEENESSEAALRREVLEELGFTIGELKFYKKVDSYYQVEVRNAMYSVHNIADIYVGQLEKKVEESVEETKLHWLTPQEAAGKLKLEFHNTILEWLS